MDLVIRKRGGSPGRRGRTKSFVKLKVFVNKPKPPVVAKIWLNVVPIDLAAALTMSFWTGRLPPRFTDFVKDESLAFRPGGFGNNRRASIGGQNQQEHKGPNEPFSQTRNPRHHLPPEYPQAVVTLKTQ